MNPLKGNGNVEQVGRVSAVKLLLQPSQHFFLVFDLGAANLGHETNPVRRGGRQVLRSLIACAAQRSKIGQVVVAAVASVHYVTDMKAHPAARILIVGLACSGTAHLTRLAVARQYLGADAGGYGPRKSVVYEQGRSGVQTIFSRLQAAVVEMTEDKPSFVGSKFPKATSPFRHVLAGSLLQLLGRDDLPHAVP